MVTTRRILLLSGAGVGLYLALSLYHGQLLQRYPAPGEEDGRLAAGEQEKNWVQVNTTGQVVGPEQPPVSPAASGSTGRPPEMRQDEEPRAEIRTLQGERERERAAREQAELDRLRAELKEARTRTLVAEEELHQARLKAEAMYQFGQEQSRLLAPAREEVELLNARLLENAGRLRRAEDELTALRAEIKALRDNRPPVRNSAGGSGATEGPAPAN